MINNNNDVIQTIKDKLDILDVVSRQVILKKKGQNYWGLCPFHKEKTPSFSVNPQKGIYKCFSCGEGGDVLSFLMKTQNKSFMEVIKDEAQALGIELPSQFVGSKDRTEIKQQVLAVLKDAAEFYNNNLFSSSATNALDYLRKRELSDETIKTYLLGYAPNSYDELYKRFSGKYSNEVLESAGLIIKKEREQGYIDRFRNRVIIPIFDENGNVVAFGARALEEGQNPKYLNSPDTIVYNKSKILYGLYHAKNAIKEEDSAIIMEGYFDVISAQAHGIKNCVASCGTSLTQGHIGLISRYSKSRKIYLSFDTDSAGLKATQRGAEVIKDAFVGLGNIKQFDEVQSSSEGDERYACEIRVIKPPEGKDPDEFIRTNGGDAFKKHLENAQLLMDFQIDGILKDFNKSSPVNEKLKYIKEIIPLLNDINNPIARNEYVKIVAERLFIDESSLLSQLKSISYYPAITKFEAPNVKKSIDFLQKAEKNLLCMYLISRSSLLPSQISEILKNEEVDDEKLKYIKSTIDKLSSEVNNVEELINILYNTFAEDNEVKNIITDLIEMSKPYDNLSEDDLRLAIGENLNKIRKFRQRQEQDKIRQVYKHIDDDDIQAVQIQIELKEKLKNKLRTGDN